VKSIPFVCEVVVTRDIAITSCEADITREVGVTCEVYITYCEVGITRGQ
jgi:hypothetical protein